MTAERGGGPVWVLQCTEHPGAISEARRLADAPATMREAIAFVADVPEGEVEVEVRVLLPEADRRAVDHARRQVRAAAQAQMTAAAEQRVVARRLIAAGLSGRDVGAVLEVSPQRVSQLVNG